MKTRCFKITLGVSLIILFSDTSAHGATRRDSGGNDPPRQQRLGQLFNGTNAIRLTPVTVRADSGLWRFPGFAEDRRRSCKYTAETIPPIRSCFYAGRSRVLSRVEGKRYETSRNFGDRGGCSSRSFYSFRRACGHAGTEPGRNGTQRPCNTARKRGLPHVPGEG
jgi:hypothetical protein